MNVAGANPQDMTILDELDKLETAENSTEANAASETTPPAGQEQPEQQTQATQEGNTAAPAEQTQATEKKPGDLRNALRAARHAEKQARAEAQKAREELEELRKKLPQGNSSSANDNEDLSDEEIAEIEADFPAQGKVLRKFKALQAKVDQLGTTTQEGSQAAEEWEPPRFIPEAQAIIDEVPDLLSWQYDKDSQDKFELAVQFDQSLVHHPDWKTKSARERIEEAVRLVKEKTEAAPSPAQTRRNPQDVINGAQASQPKGISDFRGGIPPNKIAPNFAKMSDEEILASLPDSD